MFPLLFVVHVNAVNRSEFRLDPSNNAQVIFAMKWHVAQLRVEIKPSRHARNLDPAEFHNLKVLRMRNVNILYN
jgi:hypothetical protein